MTVEDPERVARLRRLSMLYVRAPIYFVTACTCARKNILATAAVHEAFIKFGQGGPDLGAWIGSYVLIPDHLHLFVALDDRKLTLVRWMKSLKNTLSKTLRSQGVPAPHWQKGFFDHVMRSGDSYSQKWDYVRENPVRAGLVSSWEKWPFRGEIFPLEYRSDD